MAAFLSQTELSRGGLKLSLSNSFGQAQDAAVVKWTVFSSSGIRMSGDGLPAVKESVGEYYAPWFSDVSGGSYRIDWEIQEQCCGSSRTISNYFFVVSPDMYSACGLNRSVDVGRGSFRPGTQLGPDDLALYLRDDSGVLQDAFAVFWSIRNSAGCTITPRTYGARDSVGHYYASWFTAVPGGNYDIVWEFQQDENSPLQSTTQEFYVLSMTPPSFSVLLDLACYAPNPQSCTEVININNVCASSSPCGSGFLEYAPCCSSASSSMGCAPCSLSVVVAPPMPNNPAQLSSCGTFDVPRIVHVATQPLEVGGGFTSQPQYPIPTGVRKVTFYVTYTRGAVGGFPVFKLLWGNGTEEIQETVLDENLENVIEPRVTQLLYTQDLEGPTPNDGSPLSFGIYVTIPGGSTRVRLLAAEKGVPGMPGVIGITLTAST